MYKNDKFVLTKFLLFLAIIGILLMIVAPNVVGFANYEKEDIDGQNCVIIENAIKGLVFQNKILLGDKLNKEILEKEIKILMGGKIPRCESTENSFCVDRYTGDVSVKSVVSENDIKLTWDEG